MPGRKGQRSGGHNAKTVQALALGGTLRKDRHGKIASPQAPKGRPIPRKKLDGDAKAEWDAMLVDLEASGVLSPVDSAALYQYCRMFAESEELMRLKEETAGSAGIVEENIGDLEGADRVAAFQEITKLRALEAGYITKIHQKRLGLRVYLTEFGLTPASRGRVKVAEKPDGGDPFAEFETSGVQ